MADKARDNETRRQPKYELVAEPPPGTPGRPTLIVRGAPISTLSDRALGSPQLRQEFKREQPAPGEEL